MSIRKRTWTSKKAGTQTAWLVDFTNQHGEREAKQFATKEEAKIFEASTRLAVKDGKHVSATKSPLVREAGEGWHASVKANGMRGRGPVAGSTLKQYREHLDLHIYPRIGDERVGGLKKDRIEAFRKDLLDHLSREMARKVFVSFRSILKHAGCLHLADNVVGIGTVKRKIPLKAGTDIPLPNQVAKMIKVLDPVTDTRRRALVLLTAFAGPRSSELRALKWQAINFKTATLHITVRADEKNDTGPCKSDGSIRNVPLDKVTLDALRAWQLASKNSKPDDLIFPAELTNGVRSQRMMLELFHSVLIDAKLVDGDGYPLYGLHAMRHFFASWCINAKEDGGRELPAKRVQELMGHADIQITLDIYGHLFPEKSDRGELDQSVQALLR